MKNILVTGGAGYVGSHVCKELARTGFLPVTLDNLSRGHQWAVQWGPLEKGDIKDTSFVRQILEKHKIEAVVHMAAFAYVEESVRQPELYYDNNINGSLSLLKAMTDVGLKAFVFSSSCSVYGNLRKIPVDETHDLHPLSPYGETKATIEKVLREKNNLIQSVALRYFNAAGADPDGTIGEVHDPETHLIPLVLQCAKGLKESITVYGHDYETPDGTCVRDYIHVNDIAQAHVLALQKMDSLGPSEVFNLGSGTPHSVIGIVKAVESLTKKNIKVIQMGRRPGDAPTLVANATRSQIILGWNPTQSKIENILETSWRWMENYSSKVRE